MEASALTLGRVRGVALVGRPLEVSIPATLEGTEGDACADADVFYGEQKVLRPPTVRWQAGPNRQGVLYVSSQVPVDEPVVTIYLRVGCAGQAITRRFVLLSELPPTNGPSVPATIPVQPAPAPLPRVPEPAPQAAAPAPAPAVRPAPAAPPATARPAPPPATARPAAPPPARAAAPAPRATRREAAAPRGDRLKVDLLDLTSERSPALRLSSELQAVPTTDAQARASAAALWAALQRSPEEILQDAQRQQALERDLQGLRVQTQQNAAEVGKMRAQVEKARSDRQQSSLLLVVLLLVLAALAAAMGWLWWRARRLDNVRRWFDTPREPVSGPAPVAPATGGLAAPAAVAATAARPARPADPVAAPVPVGQAAAAAIAKATPSGWGTLTHAEFQPSQGGTIRMVGVQELIDVHDKADFFFALGQHEQAIEILESHVHDQVETSALAWMDLLEQYHKLDRRADFERLRAEFRQRFAVQVPDFDHFDQPTSSLENYGRALSRIVALWPSRRVLNVIEESIFRKPGLPGAEPFSLEAYRELVLLYNIAKDVAPDEDSVSAPLEYRPTDFPSTSLQPLNTLDLPERPAAARAEPPRAEPTIAEPRPFAPSSAAGPMELTPPPATEPPPQAPEATVVMGRQDSEPPPERERLLIPPSSPRIGLDIDLDAPDLQAEPGPQRELPPLDFDTSEFDHWNTHDPGEPPRR